MTCVHVKHANVTVAETCLPAFAGLWGLRAAVGMRCASNPSGERRPAGRCRPRCPARGRGPCARRCQMLEVKVMIARIVCSVNICNIIKQIIVLYIHNNTIIYPFNKQFVNIFKPYTCFNQCPDLWSVGVGARERGRRPEDQAPRPGGIYQPEILNISQRI